MEWQARHLPTKAFQSKTVIENISPNNYNIYFTTGHFFGVPKTCVEIVEPVSSAESDDWRGMTGIS